MSLQFAEVLAGRTSAVPPDPDPRVQNSVLLDYFRCPERFAHVEQALGPVGTAGYFRFEGATCYGRLSGAEPAPAGGQMPNLLYDNGSARGERLSLPFDLAEVVTNLRQERYERQDASSILGRITASEAMRSLYYFLRPALSIPIRKHLQRARLLDWKQIPFPRWPVDPSVETLMGQIMKLILRNSGVGKVPFIWFWPDGAQSCVMMTHDVEQTAGRAFCGQLMDLDDSFGIRSAFQVVPEMKGMAAVDLAASIRARGFEVNLHDLNHDGYLFRDRSAFLERAEQINRYAQALDCRGFRSGAMYREQHWYDAFEFSYDMSVPNVAHLEPQRGGCCTVMPYFVGKILELPLTTTQDYSLFHILGDYSIGLWQEQIRMIREMHGLISFVAHPDYLIDQRARRVYTQLLQYIAKLRDEGETWVALPGEIHDWWHERRSMRLVPCGGSYRVEGRGSERARLAYATLQGDRVVYQVGAVSQ